MRLTFVFLALGCETALPQTVEPPIRFTDQNNYSYEAHFDVASVAVAARQDAVVDWSALTTDLEGRPVFAAGDVDHVSLMRFADGLDEAAIEALMESGELGSAHVQASFVYENADALTSIQLTELAQSGEAFAPVTDLVADGDFWAVSLSTNGFGLPRAIVFVSPTEGSTHDRIDVVDGGTFELLADVTSLDIVSRGGTVEEIDWSRVTVDGLGESIDPDRIQEMIIGGFDMPEPGELDLIGLDYVALLGYRADVRGRTAIDPGLAENAAGEPFPGFQRSNCWAVALRCSGPTCMNPAPSFLGVVWVVEMM